MSGLVLVEATSPIRTAPGARWEPSLLLPPLDSGCCQRSVHSKQVLPVLCSVHLWTWDGAGPGPVRDLCPACWTHGRWFPSR